MEQTLVGFIPVERSRSIKTKSENLGKYKNKIWGTTHRACRLNRATIILEGKK